MVKKHAFVKRTYCSEHNYLLLLGVFYESLMTNKKISEDCGENMFEKV